jgi:hypothetical protein
VLFSPIDNKKMLLNLPVNSTRTIMLAMYQDSGSSRWPGKVSSSVQDPLQYVSALSDHTIMEEKAYGLLQFFILPPHGAMQMSSGVLPRV